MLFVEKSFQGQKYTENIIPRLHIFVVR